MPDSRIRWWKLLIIGSVITLAVGCSALRVAYSSAPTLVWWQADGWLDTDRNQAPAVRAAIDRWFAWHRSTQIAPTVALLAEVRGQLDAPVTPETVCRYGTRVQALLEPALARALDEAAELVPLLTESNLKAMASKGAQDLAEDREKYLQADLAERRAESLDRARKRYERLYGNLSDRQLAVLREGMAELPLDPERWLAEREQRLAALRMMLASPADPARQAQQQRLTEANCALAAKVHNAATPQQRSRAQANVKAWEDDLRSFLAAPAVTAGVSSSAP